MRVVRVGTPVEREAVMKTIALAVMALLATCASAEAQQNVCSGVAMFSVTTTPNKQIVAGVEGKHIELCGWYATNLDPNNNPKLATFQLTYGTGQNCANGSGAMTPQIKVESWISYFHQYTLEQAPAGAALCVNGNALPGISGVVYYGLF